MLPIRNLDEKITYYLGAGASANAIPMVGQIADRLKDFKEFLIGFQRRYGENTKTPLITENLDNLKNLCRKWSQLVLLSPSIDTLAKRYNDQGNDQEYFDYKVFLCVLFNYFHYSKKRKDDKEAYVSSELEGRYENLIRSINHSSSSSESIFTVPKNFNFISWNYDFQLEATLNRDRVNVDQNQALDENLTRPFELDIINLNGSSQVLDELQEKVKLSEPVLLEFLIKIYLKLINKPQENPLKFAWEEDADKNISMLNQFAGKSKYVVIVGYSFPSFNRDVDNAFFHNLKSGTKIFTQGYDYADSVRIEKYLRQTFIDEKPRFKITPVESPFFYVPAEYFLNKKGYTWDVG